MRRGDVPSVDLLEEIRAALDTLEPLLLGGTVDIEMSRLRVLTDPTLFRRVFAECIASALARSAPPDSITVRVARTGKAARIDVINDGGHVAGDTCPISLPWQRNSGPWAAKSDLRCRWAT